jgi:hypothetical protein
MQELVHLQNPVRCAEHDCIHHPPGACQVLRCCAAGGILRAAVAHHSSYSRKQLCVLRMCTQAVIAAATAPLAGYSTRWEGWGSTQQGAVVCDCFPLHVSLIA